MIKQISRLESEAIKDPVNAYLSSVSMKKRVLFIRRYWFCDTFAEIAMRYGISERSVKAQLSQIRLQLVNRTICEEAFLDLNFVDQKFIEESESVLSLRFMKILRCEYRSFLNNSLLSSFLSFPEVT